METATQWIAEYGYAAIFMLLMLGVVGLPVPDETLLTTVGILISKGKLHPAAAVLAAWTGSMCGISLSYVLGRYPGHCILKRWGRWIHATPQRLEQIHGWFGRAGKWALAFGYYVPGFRHLTAFVAGMSELNFGAFALFAYAGALAWSLTFISLGYFLGRESGRIAEHSGRVLLVAAIVAVVAGWACWEVRLRRGRRG